MKKHFKAHVRPLSRLPERAQTPLQIKLNTLEVMMETALLFQRQAPWKTVPWWGGNGDDNDVDDNDD